MWGLCGDLTSGDQLTAVGHHAREALQAFATALVERHQPPSVNPMQEAQVPEANVSEYEVHKLDWVRP